jgi:SET domain-containing protein
MQKRDYKKHVVVRGSKIHGSGIFASVNIPKNKVIMKIEGDVISGDECERREEEENNVYIFWNGDDCYIDTANTKKIKYINHNCEYNCEVEEDENGGLVLVSDMAIKAGEELTIDYGYEDIYDDCSCHTCAI